MRSAPGPIHGQTFAAQFMGQREGGGHIRGCRRGREIDRLGDAAVTVPLKDGLHLDVMGRSDIMGGHKEPTKLIGDLRQTLNRFMPTDCFT